MWGLFGHMESWQQLTPVLLFSTGGLIMKLWPALIGCLMSASALHLYELGNVKFMLEVNLESGYVNLLKCFLILNAGMCAAQPLLVR